jgi:hypothetical protein
MFSLRNINCLQLHILNTIKIKDNTQCVVLYLLEDF